MNWLNVVRGWVSPRKQKNGQPPSASLQAFYWSGGPVRPHDMQGLNESGAFICTTELWGLGTRLQVRLQEHRGEEAGRTQGVPGVHCAVVGLGGLLQGVGGQGEGTVLGHDAAALHRADDGPAQVG